MLCYMMALSHPFLDEALNELGPDIFRCIDKNDPSALYHIFNIYYGLEIKRKIFEIMANICESNTFDCVCDRFDTATSAFYCWGWKAMEAIDEDSEATITFLMKEHCEEIGLEPEVDSFIAQTKPFEPGLIKDKWLNDLIDVLESKLRKWYPPKHVIYATN